MGNTLPTLIRAMVRRMRLAAPILSLALVVVGGAQHAGNDPSPSAGRNGPTGIWNGPDASAGRNGPDVTQGRNGPTSAGVVTLVSR